MNILITGGAGYLGSVAAGRFLADGHAVTVLDNLLYQQTSLLHLVSQPRFRFVRGDARDERLVKSLAGQHDVIIPLAAIVGMKACDLDPHMARTVNLDSIRMLIRHVSPRQMLVFPCTNSGYGTKSGDVHCTEQTPLEPISLYGETKMEAERALLERPNAISLRLATVFGPSPRMRLDLLVNDFTYRAVTDGYLVIYEKDFQRNYLHVEDVADAFQFCIANFDRMKGEAYNVGLNDANLTKAELARLIQKRVPSFYVHYAEVGSDPDKRNYVVSNEKIGARGFAARRSVDEGVMQLIALYGMLPRQPFKNI